MNYIDYRIIEGKLRKVIVDENGNKEESKSLKIYNNENNIHNENYICNKCKKEFSYNMRREYINKKSTGRFLCNNCYGIEYNNRPNCGNRLRKEIADFRNGHLDPNSNTGKGIIFQKLTCNAHNVNDLNIENDNFNFPIDHSRHPEFGILQSKGASFNPRKGYWTRKWEIIKNLTI